jgi:CobQ-like glutamine amidotransferase family enzyme
VADVRLRIAHLYPRLMNIYGDRGNVLCLVRRCRDRGIDVEVTELGPGDRLDPAAHDLIFIGGAQDREQRRVADDLLQVKGATLREAVEAGVVVLAVCGGYQLFGRFYREASGAELPGLGVFDLHTEHPGPGAPRLIGNVVARLVDHSGLVEGPAAERRPEPVEGGEDTLAGFENHGGRTYLGAGAQPLARVVSGHGNNGGDGTEGARYRNAFGSYLHGSLLPKNPRFADRLIALALSRTNGDVTLAPLDDAVEEAAHAAALRLTGRRRRG